MRTRTTTIACVMCAFAFFVGCGRGEAPSWKEIANREIAVTRADDGQRRASLELVRIAQGLIGKGDRKRAKDRLETAIEIDPSNPYAYHVLGLVAYREGDAREALALFQKAKTAHTSASSWYFECVLLHGETAERARNWKVAARSYALASKIDESNERARDGLERMEQRVAKIEKKRAANANRVAERS